VAIVRALGVPADRAFPLPRPIDAMRESTPNPTRTSMDIERVNAIGTLLADLSARTAALRGYL